MTHRSLCFASPHACRGLALLLGLLALNGSVLAQSSPRDAATEKLREGNELFQAGDYQAALDRFLAARALFPSPRLDYNIASAYDELGKHAQAATFYARFLRKLDRPEADSSRASALQRLEELRRQLGSLTLSCPTQGAEVLLDGQALGRTPLADDPLYLDPGAHVLRVQHASHPPFLRDLVLRQGTALTIVVPWAEPGTTSKSQPAPLLAANARAESAARLRHRKTIWGYSALGVSLGLAAAAGALCAVGFLEGNDAHKAYRAAGDLNDGDAMDAHYADVEAAEKKLIAADVLAGAAALSLAFSIYELVTRPALEAPAQREARLRLAPQQAGVSLVGSF